MATFIKLNNRRADNLDGYLGQAQLGVRRSLAARAQVGLSAYVESKNVDFNLEDYRLAGLRAFVSVDVPLGLTLRPAVFIERKNFRNPSPLFTADPDERNYGASLRVEKSDLFLGNGFSPFLGIRYRRVKSGIPAFSYKETETEFGLERRF